MEQALAHAAALRAQRALLAIRVLLAGLIAAHGWARWLAGGVAPFSEWLDSQGLLLGWWIAAGITVLEVLGSPLLLLGRLVWPLCLLYSMIYSVGIVLVHWPAGWFVVGLGRNGMEYSVLLITALLAVAYAQGPALWRRN